MIRTCKQKLKVSLFERTESLEGSGHDRV